MKDILKFLWNNEIDTSVKTNIIEQSAEAKEADKKMYEVNTINQQVVAVHF